MTSHKSLLSVFLISIAIISSCGQNEDSKKMEETVEKQEPKPEKKYEKQHSYGGWYCPDNLNGFPPVDIQDLDRVPVVIGRLPSKEETQNGTSLMYFDPLEIPTARAMDIKLPRLAMHYSKHKDMNELVIIIQAVIINEDTVVGFRYPHGGNGSAWLGEVSFLSDDEIDQMGAQPFVYLKLEIKAPKEKIWSAIRSTDYAKKLAKRFDKETFFNSEWTDNTNLELDLNSDSIKASGIAATLWGNLYIQIDYEFDGVPFSEKLLVLENKENYTSELYLVMGSYPNDFQSQKTKWNEWLQDVKVISELY